MLQRLRNYFKVKAWNEKFDSGYNWAREQLLDGTPRKTIEALSDSAIEGSNPFDMGARAALFNHKE